MAEGEPDPEAVERVQRLFLRHTDVVRGFVRGLLPDPVRADDVLQETFLTLIRKAGDFDPATSFPKWACSVARYKVLEERRLMKKSTGVLSAEVIEALGVCEAALSPDPRLDRLQDCLAALPEKMRRLVRLRYQEDHTPAEVAQRMGWSAATVYVALSRLRSELKRCISNKALSA